MIICYESVALILVLYLTKERKKNHRPFIIKWKQFWCKLNFNLSLPCADFLFSFSFIFSIQNYITWTTSRRLLYRVLKKTVHKISGRCISEVWKVTLVGLFCNNFWVEIRANWIRSQFMSKSWRGHTSLSIHNNYRNHLIKQKKKRAGGSESWHKLGIECRVWKRVKQKSIKYVEVSEK